MKLDQVGAVYIETKKLVEVMLEELGPMSELEAARIEGRFYGHLFRAKERRLSGVVDIAEAVREYDPAIDVTAGELRAAGCKGLPAHYPDCAWVPRHAMRMGNVRAGAPRENPGPRELPTIEWDVDFVEPFRWVEVEGRLE
jgi:hypothetical protein